MKVKNIKGTTTIKEIETSRAYSPYQKYLMYSNAYDKKWQPDINPSLTLDFATRIGWSKEGIINGLNFLEKVIREGKTEQYFLYDEDEIGEDEQKREVNLIRIIPGKADTEKPAVLLISGGGYQAVSMMVDGLPCVRHFIENGNQVFMLTYRVGADCVTPKSVEDVANAVRYLDMHSNTLSVDINNMYFAGFSAGAHLTAVWGLENVGYKAYKLPKPKCLMLAYGIYDLQLEIEHGTMPEIMQVMFGGLAEDFWKQYDVVRNVTELYPACYIVFGALDGLVSPENSRRLKKALDESGIACYMEEAPETDHGFGDGTGTNAADWVNRALKFAEQDC